MSRARTRVPTTFPKPPRPADIVEVEEYEEAVRLRAAAAAEAASRAEVAAERAARAERRAADRAAAAAKRLKKIQEEAAKARRAADRLVDPSIPPSDSESDSELGDSLGTDLSAAKGKDKENTVSVKDTRAMFEALALPPEPPQLQKRAAAGALMLPSAFAADGAQPPHRAPLQPSPIRGERWVLPPSNKPRQRIYAVPAGTRIVPSVEADAVESRLRAFEDGDDDGPFVGRAMDDGTRSTAQLALRRAAFESRCASDSAAQAPRHFVAAPGAVSQRLSAFESGALVKSVQKQERARPARSPPQMLAMLQAYEAADERAAHEMAVQSFEHRTRIAQVTRSALG